MESDLAELFLVGFMNSLIEIRASSGVPYDNADININKEIMQKSVLKPEKVNPNQTEIPQFKVSSLKKIIPMLKPRIRSYPSHKNKTTQINYGVTQTMISSTNKLNGLIRDPYVGEIECLGSENPLIVQKSGIPQRTQINLSIDEIYELIAEFSQRTRIPIINGRIKTALDNLVITAVLSETLGPRFIIQKKRQFNNLFPRVS